MGINLLWYFPSFELGGSYPGGFRTLAIARALIRNGVSHISIASITLKESSKLSDNIDLVALPRNPFLVWKNLKNLVASEQINIVQERLGCGILWNDWGLFVGRKFSIPTICELHEYPTRFDDKLFQYFSLRYALRNCDRFLIINPIIAQHIPINKNEINKIVVMPNGYDASLASKSTLHKCEFINKSFFEKRKVIGYFGALTKDKGVDVLLDLICSLEIQPLFFIIAGHGPLESKVRAVQSRFPERIRFLGKIPQKNVYALMSICDATLALNPPEIRAGCPQFVNPLKVYESLAVGTSVVISKMVKKALPSVIVDMCTVSKLTSSDILQALEVVCDKDYGRPSEKCKEIDNYSWDSITRHFLIPLYQACIKQGHY